MGYTQMKCGLTVLQVALIGVGLAFSPGASSQPAAAAATSTSPETAPETPDRISPFSPITPTGDPFGAISSSAIPLSLMPAAGGFLVGPFSVYPVLGLAQRYDDNIFLSNTNQRSSWQTIVSPGVRAEIRQPGGNVYGVTYRADVGRFWSSSADNYQDHTVVADADVIINTQARFLVRAEYLSLHDPRGATDRPIGAEPDEWRAPGVSGLFSYGTPGAQGRIDVSAGHQRKRYDNNRASTIGADRDNSFYGAVFYWRVTPITSLLFEARQTDIDYKLATSLQDSTERRYYVGATWEATAKTTGIVKAGYLTKNFDSAALTDFSGTGWEARVRWSPLTYSIFELTTQRETNESSGIGDFILSSVVYGTWTHAWNNEVRSNALVGYRTDDFKGAGATRKDKTASAGAGVTYQFRRWLNLGAQYIYTDRSSNAPGMEYERNVFMLTLGATL